MFDSESQTSPAASDKVRHRVFVSYSHHDKEWLERLQKHLKPYAQAVAMSPWSDEQIKPGQTWLAEIQKAIAETKVAVLLVSSDFLASDFIMQQEVPLLVAAAERGEITILWVPLRPSAFSNTVLAHYHALANPARAVAELPTVAEQDAALVKICSKIHETFNPRPREPANTNLEPDKPSPILLLEERQEVPLAQTGRRRTWKDLPLAEKVLMAAVLVGLMGMLALLAREFGPSSSEAAPLFLERHVYRFREGEKGRSVDEIEALAPGDEIVVKYQADASHYCYLFLYDYAAQKWTRVEPPANSVGPPPQRLAKMPEVAPRDSKIVITESGKIAMTQLLVRQPLPQNFNTEKCLEELWDGKPSRSFKQISVVLDGSSQRIDATAFSTFMQIGAAPQGQQ